MGTTYFTPNLFDFLEDLSEFNTREWFKEHQDSYERHVREPALAFIRDFETPLKNISPHFVADPRKVGGSLFRIQRDTRFAADKTPYKTNTGLQFRHAAGKDAHAPGFYVHLEPGESFVGIGLWRPETKVAYAIREHIAANPSAWKRAAHGKKFRDVFELGGESLKRPPKGFDADHPLMEDLKRKDFIASAPLSEDRVTSDNFRSDLASTFEKGAPFMRFLCDAVGVAF